MGRKSLFALAVKLLHAILGFRGEGNCTNFIRNRTRLHASEHPAWRGVNIQTLLFQWFSFPALLSIFGGADMHSSFQDALRARRVQFLCALLRVEALEFPFAAANVSRARAQWSTVSDVFPEIEKLRAMFRS